ncbi:hypothetical protein ACXAUS_003932 [Clostridium sporogenes]|uniref:hypothetical protein n=2 Tax=Clostridium sporogenes TaxID=1509 RepID=UPI003F93D99E
MFTNFMLIQKITADGKFSQFLSNQGQFVWRFLERKQLKNDNLQTYPFEVDGNVQFQEVKRGRETSLIVNKENKTFTFKENYSVPGAFVIAVVLPYNYVPISFSFGEKSLIPIGQVKSCPPGYIEVLYNNVDKICSIVFTIINQTNFQFSCSGHYSDKDFPRCLNNYRGSVIGATIRSNNIGEEAITCNELREFSEYFKDDIDLSDIAKELNELKKLVMEDKLDTTKEEKIKTKIIQSLSNTVSVAGSIATLIDSYTSGNSVSQLISAILICLTS